VSDFDTIARQFAEIALEAGTAIMLARAGIGSTTFKSDGSPVTAADLCANEIICDRLRSILPGIPIVSEEASAPSSLQAGDRFILVDPLDGTKEFIQGRNEFTVNIGLIEREMPVAGAVFAPALGILYLAGTNSYRMEAAPGEKLAALHNIRRLKARPRTATQWRAVTSRSHLDPDTQSWIDSHPVAELRAAGSSLKFCTIAEGDADVYPRLAPTMEWDTAAADAVLRAAGGSVLDLAGAPFRYGKPDYRNGSFVAWGLPSDDPASPAPTLLL
jgi:3'(2'), 5'-bisphosphate nucleotidase